MTDPSQKKPVLHQLPAILTGLAALIASLTAVYVNLRNDREHDREHAASIAAVQPARDAQVSTDAPTKEAAKPIDRFVVRVDRIAVEHDGSPGTTDWRFTVEADADALFAFQQDDLDDTGGRNVAIPKDAEGTLRMEGRPGVRIVVKGWRGRLLGLAGEPDVTGEGRMSATGGIGAIRVAADKPEAGAFVFHLSADAAR